MSTVTFVECVSCGREQTLLDGDVTDRDAAREAHRLGWTVRGFYGAHHTRCPSCRGRTDTRALDEGLIGHRAGGQTTGRARL